MRAINLDRIIHVSANVGVIAGIIFLGIELRQNNEALETQARLERESAFRAAFARGMDNPDLTRAKVKTRRGEALTDEEALVLEMDNEAILIDWMLAYGLVRDDVLGEEAAIPVQIWRETFHRGRHGLPELWSAREHQFSPDFVQWMEENVVNEH